MIEYVAINLKDLQKLKALAGCELVIHDDKEFQSLMDLDPKGVIAYHNALASLYKKLTKACMNLEYLSLNDIDLDYYYSRC